MLKIFDQKELKDFILETYQKASLCYHEKDRRYNYLISDNFYNPPDYFTEQQTNIHRNIEFQKDLTYNSLHLELLDLKNTLKETLSVVRLALSKTENIQIEPCEKKQKCIDNIFDMIKYQNSILVDSVKYLPDKAV
ncbi:hypothetical protein C0585_06195 [Candidatus Woesearchaeota archaeon]|nr:MAG: hypothetical protein C0585_06195 [Candidatus Woesearchaeota archaeon]